MKPISPAEWEVLTVVWNNEPVTATKVYEALPNEAEWRPKTVNTFLARLVKKKILNVQRDGKANVYTSAVTKEQCVRRESESFLKRVFRGATGPLLAHFCESADLTDDEVAQLQKLLQQRTRKGRKK